MKKEEVEETVKRLKARKVTGGDKIGNEWKYAGEGLRREVWKVCRKEGKRHTRRKTRIIIPLKKKEK